MAINKMLVSAFCEVYAHNFPNALKHVVTACSIGCAFLIWLLQA